MSYNRERQHQTDHATSRLSSESSLAPGTVTLVDAQLGAVQRKATHQAGTSATRSAEHQTSLDGVQFQPGETADAFRDVVEGMVSVQRSAAATVAPASEREDEPLRLARRGLTGSSRALPHLTTIQASFGRHDVSGVQAHVGGPAAHASEALGAEAYASGNAVAFRNEPDLFTAAHEAAHVVQQRRGVQLLGGVGQAGDTYEQHADAVATAVVQGRSAESLLDGAAAGNGASGAAVQRWQAGVPKFHAEKKGGLVLAPQVTTIGIEEAPNVVLSQYTNAYTPRIALGITGGTFLTTFDRGDLYVSFSGAIPKRVHVPNREGSWQTPPEATVARDMLVDPGKGKAGASRAHLYAEYVAKTFDDGTDTKSPTVDILAYHDAFKGTAQASKTEVPQLDVANKILIDQPANNTQATVIHQTWSQQTSVTASQTSNVAFGQTLTSSSTTGVTGGAKGVPGIPKLTELNFGFSQQWTQSEMDSYTSSAGSGWSESVGQTTGVTVDTVLPEGFKGSVVLYPFTQRRLDWVESRRHDGQGQIMSGDEGTERAWVAFNAPGGGTSVLGVDPSYLAAYKKKFQACSQQYHDAQAIERQYNAAAAGPGKEELAKQLEAAKDKLVALLQELVNLQPNREASIADADAQIRQVSKPADGTVMSSEVNSIIVQNDLVKAWRAYAASPTLGR